MNKLTKLAKKNQVWIMMGVFVLVIVSFMKEPVFFDSFGLPVFLFLFLANGYMLINKKYPEWIMYTTLIIGASGLIVDGIQILK